MISRLAGSIKAIELFFNTYLRSKGNGNRILSRRSGIILKYSCAASEIRTIQRKVRQGEAKSDISESTLPHNGLFITAFQQLTRDHTCSHSSVPAFIHSPLIELTHPYFIFIQYRTNAMHFHAVPVCSRA